MHARDWLCECGGLFAIESWEPFDPDRIDTARPGLWRYRQLLPLDSTWQPVQLGEGSSPLILSEWHGVPVHFKLEYMAPSGSFKDRGNAVMVTALRGMGIKAVVDDSSGNAGASLSAYAGRAGINCELCVPHTATGPKLAQMAAHGAEVIEIKGRREYAALAAWAAAAHGAFYASHAYNPFFLAGIETLAYEVWEQLGHAHPDSVIMPVGTGAFLVGVYNGFRRLREAGLITGLPRLFAVQSAACAPVALAFANGQDDVTAVTPKPTVATGIAISRPTRGRQILDAIRYTNGAVVTVEEEQIVTTRNELARQGFYIEATSAAAVAAIPEIQAESGLAESLVVPLTGHGLKQNVAA
ncbi:threonine synthase [Chloroflexota bacterium]